MLVHKREHSLHIFRLGIVLLLWLLLRSVKSAHRYQHLLYLLRRHGFPAIRRNRLVISAFHPECSFFLFV